MARAFCPKCGNFSFGYDPLIKIYRCYSMKCEFMDREKEYGEGLSENPFNKRDYRKRGACGEGRKKEK